MSLRDLLNDTLESAKSGVRSFLTKPRQSLANNQVLQKAAYYTPDVARNISDFVKGTNNPVTSARSLMGEAGKIRNPIVRSTAQLGLYPVTQGSRIVQGTRDVAANIPEAVSNLSNNQKFDPALSKILEGLGETATGMFNLTPMGAGFNAAFSGGSGAVGASANKKNPVTGAIEAFANEKTPSQAIAPKLAEKYPLAAAGADILAGVLADKGLTKGKKTLDFVQKVRNINPRSWVSVDPQRPGWKIPVKNLIKYAKGEYSAGRIDDDAKAVLKFLQKNPEYAFLSEQLNKPKTRLEPGFINFSAEVGGADDNLLGEARKYKSAEEFLDRYKRVYHQTSPENASKIEIEGFRTDLKGSGGSDFLPEGVNTKSSDVEIPLRGRGSQMEVFISKKANVRGVENRGEATKLIIENDPTGEYEKMVDEIDRVENFAAREFDRLDEEFYSQKGLIRKPGWRDEVSAKQKKILDDANVKVRELAARARSRAAEVLRKQGIDVLYIRDDVGGWTNKLHTDNYIVLDPKALKTKSQLIDIWNQAKDSEVSMSIKPNESIPKGTGKVQLPKQREVLPNIKGPEPSVLDTKQPLPQLEKNRIQSLSQQQGSQPYDDIITEAKKQIGSLPEEEPKSLKQTLDNIYTQWVDRYNPIVKVSREAKKTLKAQGAELRPEYDPEYLVRRLTGAGGIADARFRRELEPIINKADELGIDKADLDIYLVNRRTAGFGKIGREVKGSDPQKAGQVVSALESKYGDNIKSVAQQLYDYQNKGFQEMVDAGFISPETAKLIRKENPDYVPFQRVMDEVDNYLGLPTRKTMQGTQPIKKLEGSEKQILSPVEEIIANTFKQRAAIEKNRVARSIVDLQKVAPNLGFAKAAESGTDTITVWNNGKKEFWKVGQEIADTAKGINEENMNTLLKIFTAPASLLRQGATGRNPEFMLPNMVRDQLDAGITSKYGYIPFVDYLRGLKSMLLDDDIYRAWENSGAKIDLGELSGRKAINQRFSEATGKGGLFKWLGDVLDTAGTFSEQPTRVGLFKRAYEKTRNPLIAAMESRDATVDFARMGSKMKVANSMIPFLNVGVQGFDKLIRSVKNNPSKVALNAAIYGVLPAVTVTAYNLLNHPEEYAEIPQYEKDSNFVLVNGRNPDGTVAYVALPKGNVIPVITNPIENFMSFVAGTNKQKFSEFALQFVSSALPVIGDGQSVKEIAVKTVGSNLPQLVKPITENLVNKSFYKYDAKKEQSKEIVPFYLQEKEPYQQAYEFTPGLYKTIGAVLNVSPLQVQNAMEGYLAGYAKIPANIFESITKIKEGREVSPNEKPLLRRFFKQTYPSSNVKKEEKPSTSLMQRVLPKSEAAMATEQDIKDIKKSVKETGKQANVGDTILFKDGETVKSVKSNIKPPELTKNNELNKKILAEYKSDVSDYVDYVMYLYKTGKITQDQAGKELDKVKAINKAISSATATKKASKAKKVNFSKIAEQTLKPVKVQTSTPRLRTQDVLEDFAKLKAKAPKIEVPEIKKGKK